jgi:hypothetical protein
MNKIFFSIPVMSSDNKEIIRVCAFILTSAGILCEFYPDDDNPKQVRVSSDVDKKLAKEKMHKIANLILAEEKKLICKMDPPEIIS